MPAQPDFDLQVAHKYFSANCFNKTWEFIDNPNRTEEDNLSMLQTAMASLWHWTQREHAKSQNLSVRYWQVSRVYSLLGQADDAREYAQASLNFSEGGGAFYTGFAYESLARAEMVAGNQTKMNEYLEKAHPAAEKIEDPEDKKVLMDDLDLIK